MINLLVSLQLENYSLKYTYQQDSMKEVILFDELNQTPEATEVMGTQAGVTASEPVSVVAVHSSEKAAMPVRTVVRRNLVQGEQQFLIGNSRFIESRNDVELIASLSISEDLHLPERPVQQVSYDWIALLLLMSLGLFASVKTIWGKYLTSLFHSAVNYSTALRMYQEKNNSLMQGAFLLDLLFYLIFSVFLFQVFTFFGIEVAYQHFSMYLYCLALLAAYFLVKKLFYKIIGMILMKKEETGEYLYNMDNFKRVAGLVIIPLVAVIAFYPYRQENIPVIAGVSIVGLIYFLLILRGFKIILRKQFSIFYLFLYFCTLELLPLVLLYKILVV